MVAKRKSQPFEESPPSLPFAPSDGDRDILVVGERVFVSAVDARVDDCILLSSRGESIAGRASGAVPVEPSDAQAPSCGVAQAAWKGGSEEQGAQKGGAGGERRLRLGNFGPKEC